jgi:hypothetical protein
MRPWANTSFAEQQGGGAAEERTFCTGSERLFRVFAALAQKDFDGSMQLVSTLTYTNRSILNLSTSLALL